MGIIKIANRFYNTETDIEIILEKISETTNFGAMENYLDKITEKIHIAEMKLDELNVKISKLDKRLEKKGR